MNNIHNNRVGYISKISKNILPVFLLALFLSSGIFLTSCSDPLIPIEEKKIDKVDDSFNQNVNNNFKSFYTLSTFKKNVENSNVINLNESVKFNDFAKYQIQIKDFKSNNWVDLEIESQDGDVSHLKPKKKLVDNGTKMENSFLSLKNLRVFVLLKDLSQFEFVNDKNQYLIRLIEMNQIHNSDNQNYESNLIINENDLIEFNRYNNITECKNKIKENEFK